MYYQSRKRYTRYHYHRGMQREEVCTAAINYSCTQTREVTINQEADQKEQIESDKGVRT